MVQQIFTSAIHLFHNIRLLQGRCSANLLLGQWWRRTVGSRDRKQLRLLKVEQKLTKRRFSITEIECFLIHNRFSAGKKQAGLTRLPFCTVQPRGTTSPHAHSATSTNTDSSLCSLHPSMMLHSSSATSTSLLLLPLLTWNFL